MIKSSKSGFTLAEVLTTLMVIGVVAAMTIPTLLNSTGDATAKAGARKAASVLSQAIQMLQAKESDCTVKNSADLANCMKEVIAGTVSGSKITTPDGFVYAFALQQTYTNAQEVTAVCGDFSNDHTGNCLVLVDTNGAKGSSNVNNNFAVDGTGDTAISDSALIASYNAKDIAIFQMSDNTVRPAYVAGTGASNYTLKYINDSQDVTANPYTELICCDGSWEPCAAPNETKVYCKADATTSKTGKVKFATKSCPSTHATEITSGKTFVRACPTTTP